MIRLRVLSSAVVRPADEPDWTRAVPASLKRRDPRIWQVTYAAAALALAGTTSLPRSIISATALGALDETQSFLDALYRTGLGSPRNFMSSVHNSMAGKLAIELKIHGPNLTLCDGVNSLASALTAASLLDPAALPSLVLLSDEKTALLTQLASRLPASCGFLARADWEEGAAAFVVDRAAGTDLSVDAQGPTPVLDETPEAACGRIAGPGGFSAAEVAAASASFVAPGALLHDMCVRKVPGRIPTHDPRARSVAVIDVRI